LKLLKQTNLFHQSTLFALPIWIFLLIDVYALDVGFGKLSAILHSPGLFLMLLVNPTWEQMHNYQGWHYLIGNYLFYYLLILATVALWRWIKRRDRSKELGL
jgi:hypothetical protein